ncbi:sterile alpha motif domain-containing protein 15-like [Liolophura sinensis]|uniref:sterile alpha motif domain-containing protein 15-like n=1 Tax=Liolophura sinensis TaxID=3198878 RepID=UPI003159614F
MSKMSPKKTSTNISLTPDAEVADRMDCRLPRALYWSTNQVANWIAKIGFPFYKNCFTDNYITGRRLIKLDASSLPRIGICDFDHIKFISKSIRALLKIEEIPWDHHMSLQPRSDVGMYLETKCFNGKYRDQLTYESFLSDSEDKKWKPPLTNFGILTPSSNHELGWHGRMKHNYRKIVVHNDK